MGETYDMNRICYLPTLLHSFQTKKGYSEAACGRKDRDGLRKRGSEDCMQTVRQLFNVASLAGWVIFNEGWGQFDTKEMTALEKEAGMAAGRWMRRAAGSIFGGGDYRSEHNYFFKLQVSMKWKKNPGGRAFVISEYGGLTLKIPGHIGRSKAMDMEDCHRRQNFRSNSGSCRGR